MKPGFFIDRPIFSAVLSILIVLVGFIGLTLLPIDQYPQITPPRGEDFSLLSGGKCRDCIPGRGNPYRAGIERYPGNALHGVQ